MGQLFKKGDEKYLVLRVYGKDIKKNNLSRLLSVTEWGNAYENYTLQDKDNYNIIKQYMTGLAITTVKVLGALVTLKFIAYYWKKPKI